MCFNGVRHLHFWIVKVNIAFKLPVNSTVREVLSIRLRKIIVGRS